MEKSNKLQIIKKNARHEKDTGSTEVQIAIMTDRISNLTEHLKTNKKDYDSRRGLFKIINNRRKLLKYLFRSDPAGYESLISKLGIRSTIRG